MKTLHVRLIKKKITGGTYILLSKIMGGIRYYPNQKKLKMIKITFFYRQVMGAASGGGAGHSSSEEWWVAAASGESSSVY